MDVLRKALGICFMIGAALTALAWRQQYIIKSMTLEPVPYPASEWTSTTRRVSECPGVDDAARIESCIEQLQGGGGRILIDGPLIDLHGRTLHTSSNIEIEVVAKESK